MSISLKSNNIECNLGRSPYRNYKIISTYGQLNVIKQHQFYIYTAVF